MQRQVVTSSMIQSVGYDPIQEVLEVEFNNDAVYQYTGVPYAVHANLVGAKSVGRFFLANVKGSYDYEKVS